jgi:hypothetical protein
MMNPVVKPLSPRSALVESGFRIVSGDTTGSRGLPIAHVGSVALHAYSRAHMRGFARQSGPFQPHLAATVSRR